jgi:ribosomal-protein-alanine N-acetyltransferase
MTCRAELGGIRLARLTTVQLDAVMVIENAAYDVPWTRGNFVDSLASGYLATCLLNSRGALLGYCIAMPGHGELHLLNLTVAPEVQGRGHARVLLDALVVAGRQAGMTELWLEVRASNVRARDIYRRYGLVATGVRKAYYPTTALATREDAVVMNLCLGEAP